MVDPELSTRARHRQNQRRTVQVRWLYPTTLILAACVAVLGAIDGDLQPLAVLVVVLLAIGVLLAWRDVRRARRYLQTQAGCPPTEHA